MYLENITSPADVKKIDKGDLPKLAEECREVLIDTVSENGGHLASNLGVVELTIALHRVFNSPKDKIIWDVGHQCYTHKLLTADTRNFPPCARRTACRAFQIPTRASTIYFSAVIRACRFRRLSELRPQTA